MAKNIMATALGGALGTLCRYGLNMQLLWTGHPIGTVIENVIGSLLLGLLTGWVLHQKPKEWIKVGVDVGFCGGFTTMSTLAADTVFLANQSAFSEMILYLMTSLFGGLVFAFAGLVIGTKLGERKAKEASMT